MERPPDSSSVVLSPCWRVLSPQEAVSERGTIRWGILDPALTGRDNQDVTPTPKRPDNISEFAGACLESLSAGMLGERLSLGGAFGLSHYLEYRPTHDIDAWWIQPVPNEQKLRIVKTLEEALQVFGEVRTRSWGDVVSVELRQKGKTVFSFQIADRSAEIHAPTPSPWPGGIRLDSLEDLIAGKMVALVERGNPRDFRDIYTLCREGLTDTGRCWDLWQKRQDLSGENTDRARAALAVRTHLARIEQARPLERLESSEREKAERVRIWFAQEFLRDLPD